MPREVAALVPASGPTGAGRLLLNPPAVTIGRAEGSTYVIDDPLISRQHAQIRSGPTEGHRYIVEDLKSRNGTFVNGRRLTEACVLEQSDEVRFGPYTFTFEDPNATLQGDGPTTIVVDGTAGTVRVHGELLPLSNKEFALLELLYRNLDRPVHVAEISQVVWPEYDGATTLSQVDGLVRRLREKIAASGTSSMSIASQRGRGYVLKIS